MLSLNSFDTLKKFSVEGSDYYYYSLASLQEKFPNIARLPFSLKVLLENLLRFEEGSRVTKENISTLANWGKSSAGFHEIAFHPARILMQDFTGVPAIVDLAAMREAIHNLEGDPDKVNPLTPVDLVIDHSVQVDYFGNDQAFEKNVNYEMARNNERYAFLRWGQAAFKNFRVVPPGTGICHQVNLEYLAKGVWVNEEGEKRFAYPDTLLGTDSHTTMINGLGVLGWGVGGIEAEAAMLGQPFSMLIPEVIGFKLVGKLSKGTTATDLVLTVTQMLRARGVVGKFVEFYGSGLKELMLPDRATVANMAPEYGATCGFFPIDQITLDYLRLTGRDEHTLKLVEAYTKEQGLWLNEELNEVNYTDSLYLDLESVEPSLAGPKRPQDRVKLIDMPNTVSLALSQYTPSSVKPVNELNHGDVVIAAITSCTNTSNPSVLMAAGLLAKKAIEKGLKRKPWVKSSLAPGSKVVTSYLEKAKLQPYLDELGFNLVGYGCTTCIGNSGPLPEEIAAKIEADNLWVCAVLSGNRNFEGRIHPQVKANWLASPPLVVAYALAGTTRINLLEDPLGLNERDEKIFLRDIWPTPEEIQHEVNKIDVEMFKTQYADVFHGDKAWRDLPIEQNKTYHWDINSTYIQHPPYFTQNNDSHVIENARILALFGDSITTDHISPAGAIKPESPAGKFLLEKGVNIPDFNSYGSRRGNHEIMMRGTFANIRIKNEMLNGIEGGLTLYLPTEEILPIYDAAMRYCADETPLVVIAGQEYGTGSSRDWAAKGTRLLGIKAVIAESFERIHRSNLIGMGVLPLEFIANQNRKTLGFKGHEIISIQQIEKFSPRQVLQMRIKDERGERTIEVMSRLDTQEEIAYYQSGGILRHVLKSLSIK